MKDKAIIFFTRVPSLGKTKTRLEPFLKPEECVELQENFIRDIYNMIREVNVDIIVNYSEDGDLEGLKSILKDDLIYLKQSGAGLGEKMNRGIAWALKTYKKVILIGSDLPLLEKEDIDIAFEILDEKDIVISKTLDGGYYLIGMKEEYSSIFNMEYSTEYVFEETVQNIKDMGKSLGTGNIQMDIDDKSDFLELMKILDEKTEVKCKNTYRYMNEIMKKW